MNLKLPFVSVCTPTYNRRKFIPALIKCFEKQNLSQKSYGVDHCR